MALMTNLSVIGTTASTLTIDDVRLYIKDLAREVLDRHDLDISDDKSPRDVPGWDSLNHIEIILAAQNRFKIRMLSRELDQLNTIGDLVALIHSKASGAANEPRRP
jgi:acyl carrier protein